MKIHSHDVIFVISVAFASWIVLFSLDSYVGGREWRTSSDLHHSNNAAPFPDNTANNIFWFLQVNYDNLLKLVITSC